MPKAMKSKRSSCWVANTTKAEFAEGDIVFAKMTGYPPWPAKVLEVISVANGGDNLYTLAFYATYDKALMKASNMRSFEVALEESRKNAKHKLLRAIAEAIETPHIVDIKLKEHATADIKPTARQVAQKRPHPKNTKSTEEDSSESDEPHSVEKNVAGQEDTIDVERPQCTQGNYALQKKAFENLGASKESLYKEQETTDLMLKWSSQVMSSVILLGRSLFLQKAVNSGYFKKITSGMASLNPNTEWEEADILFMLRLVACWPASDRSEILKLMYSLAKKEDSPQFMIKLVEELVESNNPQADSATLMKKVCEAIKEGNQGTILSAFGQKHGVHRE